MQIKINEIKVPIIHTKIDIERAISAFLRIKPSSIISFKILRKSIDSRQREVKYVYSLAVDVLDKEKSSIAANKYLPYKEEINTIDELLKEYNKKSFKYRNL